MSRHATSLSTANGQHRALGVRNDLVRRGIGQMRSRAGYAVFRLDAENDESRFAHMSEFENPVGGVAALNEKFRFAPGKCFGGNEFSQEVFGGLIDILGGNEFACFRLRDDVEQDQACLKFLRERYCIGGCSG